MEQSAKKYSRLQSTLLVIGLLGLVLTSIFLSRRSVHEVQQASVAIYQDRLVPSGILVNLTSAIYQKRLVLDTYVLTRGKSDTRMISSELERLNRRIDSLLTDFERTKLTVREGDRLQLLRERLSIYNSLETQLTTNQPNQPGTQRTRLIGTSSASFGQVTQMLDELSALQLTVGKELLSESRGQANYIYVLTALQIGLVLLIGVSLFWHRF